MRKPLTILLSVLAVLVFALPASVAGAEGPYLVRDLRVGMSSNARDLVAIGERVFFTANDGVSGRELYVSDGTFDGTHRVKDIRVGKGSADPTALTAFGGKLAFIARDGVHGPGIYVTDGTAKGTKRIARSRGCSEYDAPYATDFAVLGVAGNTLYFPRYDADQLVCNLYGSDGTVTGTHVVAHNILGFNLPTEYAGQLFFMQTQGFYWDDVTLFKTDASETGISQVKAFGSAYLAHMIVSGKYLYIRAGDRLWRSDGTTAGTTKVVSPDGPLAGAWALTNLNGILYLGACRVENHEDVDCGLWRTNGKTAGTTLVKELNNDFGIGDGPDEMTVIGNELIFTADMENEINTDWSWEGLWRSDGTSLGTVKLVESAMYDITTLGDQIYFGGCPDKSSCDPGARVNMTDTSGTPLVALPGVFNVQDLTATHSSIFFVGYDDGWQHTGELFRYVP